MPRPTNTNIVCCIWLFRHKYLAYGTFSRYKARLVANGSTQLEGVYVDKTFSPVVKPGTIRTILSLATFLHWSIHQLDVKNTFIHGDLSEIVYMHQPLGLQDSVHPDYVINSLHQEFSRTDLGSLNYFMGISVTRDSTGMFLSQHKYVVEILKRAYMANCNPSWTPVDTESKLGDDGDLVSDPNLYRSLAGSLQYLTFTRPDISYEVQQVCLYMHDPREPHFSALKRILRYVRGTLDHGVQLFASSTTSLVAYSDADWGGFPTTRRSTSGYCLFLGNNVLFWSSKRQPTLSCSSAEVEYRGVANFVVETCWLRNLLRELHTPLSFATLVYCDNQKESLAIAKRNLFDDEASTSNNTRAKPPTPPRTLHEHSHPNSSSFQNPIILPAEQTGRIIDARDILLIQETCTFQGLRSEDPLRYVKHYLSIIDNIQADGTTKDTSRLRFFHLSLKGKAAEWFDRIPLLKSRHGISSCHDFLTTSFRWDAPRPLEI
ncbi:ribonuclease H-like domain-containing protein [Tanacetum coccineum]